MLRRFLPLVCGVMGLALVGVSHAQDMSAMWNAAKRWKLGLDVPARPVGDPGVPFAVLLDSSHCLPH